MDTIEEWDTTLNPYNYKYPIDEIYYQNKISLRRTFNLWIGKISENYKSDIDWWINKAGERNNLSSQLFHYVCILETLRIAKERKILIKKIKLNNKKISLIIKKKFGTYNIEINSTQKNFKNLIYGLTYYFFLFVISKFFFKKINNTKSLSIIDIFLTSRDPSTKRYYGNLEETTKQKNVIFLFSIIDIKFFDLFFVIRKIFKKKNYYIKESFLRFRDLLDSFSFFLRLKKYKRQYVKILDYDLTSVIIDELHDCNNVRTIIGAKNNYHVFRNLKKKNIDIQSTINWFENTSVDKSWNFAVNKFFPKADSYGYQGFTCYKDFACLDPCDHEKKYNLIPKKIVLIGSKLEDAKKEFCNSLNILQGPALRFDHLNQKIIKKEEIILVCLNLEEKLNYDIVKVISSSKLLRETQIVIKPHPALKLKSNILNKLQNYKISSDTFENLIYKSKLLITAGSSSTVIESFACGTRVIVPVNDLMLKYTLEKLEISKKFYRFVQDPRLFDIKYQELLEEKNKILPEEQNNIKKDFFNIGKSNLLDFSKVI